MDTYFDLEAFGHKVKIATDRIETEGTRFWKDYAYAHSIGTSFDCMAKLYFRKRVDPIRTFDLFTNALDRVDGASSSDVSVIAYPLSDHFQAIVSKNSGSRMKLDVGTVVASAWHAVAGSRRCEIVHKKLFHPGPGGADRPFEAADAIEWILVK